MMMEAHMVIRQAAIRNRLIMAGNEPMIDQGIINGWNMSWNPDDNRYYVARTVRGDELEFVASYNAWRNAVQYARKHSI